MRARPFAAKVKVMAATAATLSKQPKQTTRNTVKKFINKMSKFIWSNFSFRRCELCDKPKRCFCFSLSVFSLHLLSSSSSIHYVRTILISMLSIAAVIGTVCACCLESNCVQTVNIARPSYVVERPIGFCRFPF